jgi:hypothetical protein
MQLPFSRDAFLDILAAYNAFWWPVALALWLVTLLAFVLRLRGRDAVSLIPGLLAFHWAWSGVAYHAALFSQINPAAWGFAALFVMQAGLLTWYGMVERRLHFSGGSWTAQLVGYALIAYGLLYPLIVLTGDHSYPRAPTFGLPCPTVIVTAGFLMLARDPIPPLLVVVPVVWALIGGSAAFLLDVRADLALPVAGFALAARTLSTRAALRT